MTPEEIQEMKTMIQEVQKSLEFTGTDGTPVKIVDALKAFPELQLKYADCVKRLENMEKMAAGRKWASIPGIEPKKFSLFRAIRGIIEKDFTEAPYEREVMDEAKKKAMGFSSDTAGGFLVPPEAIPELIEMLRSEPVCTKLGARIIPGLQGAPVYWPKQTGGATVYWVGENSAVTPSDLAFGQLALNPHKAMALVPVSNSLLRMAQPQAEQIITQDIGLQMALAVDLAALRGSGNANQPLGIANTPDIKTYALGADGLVLSNLDIFAEMEYKLSLANSLRGSLGFAFHPIIKKNLKQLKIPQYANDGGIEPLMFPFTDAALAAAMGYPFATSNQLPINLVKGNSSNCTEIYFGNWNELLIGMWASIRIMTSDTAGTAFAADQTWIRIIIEVDIGVRHPESFCLCNDARIAAS